MFLQRHHLFLNFPGIALEMLTLNFTYHLWNRNNNSDEINLNTIIVNSLNKLALNASKKYFSFNLLVFFCSEAIFCPYEVSQSLHHLKLPSMAVVA
jgi:hypothetical protein